MNTDYHELKRVPTDKLAELIGTVGTDQVVHTLCDRINILEQAVERLINERNNVSDKVRVLRPEIRSLPLTLGPSDQNIMPGA